MGFASSYLSGRVNFPQLITEAPDPKTGLIIVIPAFNEPDITGLLSSLADCILPGCAAEVIIVVNSPENAPAKNLIVNRKTISDIMVWKEDHRECFFSVHTIDTSSLDFTGWNVGLARKTGMDEAVRRFDAIENKDGVIICLDADCTVESSYFSAIFKELYKRSDRSGCSIYFEHPLAGPGYSRRHYSSITLYELHLRYYYQGLAFAGFPYVHHTVGSAMAVKVLAYIRSGGMNRKSAGEDFYFIQKLVQTGGYFNLNATTVFPSPRSSVRVPFGTGATMKKLTENETEVLLTYNTGAFLDLKNLFSMVSDGSIWKSDGQTAVYAGLPESLRLFIGEEEWLDRIGEIKRNTSGYKSFIKRFFAWFNMFMTVKYMNFVHRGYYKKKPVSESASELLRLTGDPFDNSNPLELLIHYRQMEKRTSTGASKKN